MSYNKTCGRGEESAGLPGSTRTLFAGAKFRIYTCQQKSTVIIKVRNATRIPKNEAMLLFFNNCTLWAASLFNLGFFFYNKIRTFVVKSEIYPTSLPRGGAVSDRADMTG